MLKLRGVHAEHRTEETSLYHNVEIDHIQQQMKLIIELQVRSFMAFVCSLLDRGLAPSPQGV